MDRQVEAGKRDYPLAKKFRGKGSSGSRQEQREAQALP